MEQDKKAPVSLGKYVLSDIIDAILYTVVFSLLSIIFTGKVDNLPNSVAWIPICLYVGIFHCYLNWTPGMKIMGYKFVDSTNPDKKLGVLKMIIHWFVSLLLKFSLLFGTIALFTFKSDTGFYWDRWFKIKITHI